MKSGDGTPKNVAWQPRARPEGGGLHLERLSKFYGTARAVDDVSLSLAPGEFLTLLGPSGSGKTTLLMMIAGFVTPTKGTIRFGDRVINEMPPEKRNFGMVFQGYMPSFPILPSRATSHSRWRRAGSLGRRLRRASHRP